MTVQDRSGYLVSATGGKGRYRARGVSPSKSEVHSAVDRMDAGLFPGAFCKVTEDYLGGDPKRCNIIHADGAGTKSIVAYLHYKEFGDPTVFHGIAQDSIVMNLDDLLCVGVRGRTLISNTVNRNAVNCPGEVISALIEGAEIFLQTMREHGVEIYSGGGETADVGDLTGTLAVDSCAVAVMEKKHVITNRITGGLAILGLSATGQAIYEAAPNSGMGSNGLTSARHELLSGYYAEKYPESFDGNIPPHLVYCGPYRLEDTLPGSAMTVGEAILSPARSYAPAVYRLREELGDDVKGMVHCSGGGQTKCLKFGRKIHFVKNGLFDPPPLFTAIQKVSGTSSEEMYQVFNMGHRMEIYVPPERADDVIGVAVAFGIDARVIGHTESADSNRLTITTPDGEALRYH